MAGSFPGGGGTVMNKEKNKNVLVIQILVYRIWWGRDRQYINNKEM